MLGNSILCLVFRSALCTLSENHVLMGYEQGCKKITVKNMHNHGSFWKNWENYGKSLCLIFIVILKEKYDKTHTTLSSETLDERHIE